MSKLRESAETIQQFVEWTEQVADLWSDADE
jgi:hypothetical protein